MKHDWKWLVYHGADYVQKWSVASSTCLMDHEKDPVRSELKRCSSAWHLLSSADGDNSWARGCVKSPTWHKLHGHLGQQKLPGARDSKLQLSRLACSRNLCDAQERLC
ncbi:unnamed protein product [Polarella glacialis]|uniref:Uncharacterized protein n=1 Tax=Polarella glacialis TaxID=89957 RepID=A0A813J795_POLGL|nr:unnamed protein product [Polarella glacialis]